MSELRDREVIWAREHFHGAFGQSLSDLETSMIVGKALQLSEPKSLFGLGKYLIRDMMWSYRFCRGLE